MTKRTKYYLLQKLMGVFFIVAGVVPLWLDRDSTMLVLCLPMGLWFIFSKEPIVINNLYFEMKEEKRQRRNKRS